MKNSGDILTAEKLEIGDVVRIPNKKEPCYFFHGRTRDKFRFTARDASGKTFHGREVILKAENFVTFLSHSEIEPEKIKTTSGNCNVSFFYESACTHGQISGRLIREHSTEICVEHADKSRGTYYKPFITTPIKRNYEH